MKSKPFLPAKTTARFVIFLSPDFRVSFKFVFQFPDKHPFPPPTQASDFDFKRNRLDPFK